MIKCDNDIVTFLGEPEDLLLNLFNIMHSFRDMCYNTSVFDNDNPTKILHTLVDLLDIVDDIENDALNPDDEVDDELRRMELFSGDDIDVKLKVFDFILTNNIHKLDDIYKVTTTSEDNISNMEDN